MMGSEAACAKNRKLPNIVGLGWATGGDGQGTDRSSAKRSQSRSRNPSGDMSAKPFSRVAIPQHRGPVLRDSTKEQTMQAITLNDVHAAAAAHGLSPINALTAMQSVAAKSGDSALLDRLCELKSQLTGL